MIKGEMGKSSRLAWSCEVLAVEPGRLPAPDRLRESHRREGTPIPLLNTQTPHIWITWVFSSFKFAFFTVWERIVKMCLKRPQYGRHPRKFSHMDTNAERYVMVLGVK